MVGQNINEHVITELKLLKSELEEGAHKERAKISKAEVRLASTESRLWALGHTLRLLGEAEGQRTLDEALKRSEEAFTPST